MPGLLAAVANGYNRANRDGTYAIAYDDGERERRVRRELIKVLDDGGDTDTATDTDAEPSIERGTKVEASRISAEIFFLD